MILRAQIGWRYLHIPPYRVVNGAMLTCSGLGAAVNSSPLQLAADASLSAAKDVSELAAASNLGKDLCT